MSIIYLYICLCHNKRHAVCIILLYVENKNRYEIILISKIRSMK
jgi:hypothetical protein